MLLRSMFALLSLLMFSTALAEEKKSEGKVSALDHKMKTLSGEEVDLAEKYAGKVVLVVNVASRCGLTPQYADLQKLHEKYKGKGLALAGFPCNQFGKQEPGSSDEIASFCKENYGVTFDMYEKIDVNGEAASELYKNLTSIEAKPAGAGKISWNFEKFLIGRDGQVIARFEPKTDPMDEELVAALEKALAQE